MSLEMATKTEKQAQGANYALLIFYRIWVMQTKNLSGTLSLIA